LHVLLFAGLAEDVGSRELVLDDGDLPATVGELERRLRDRWPVLAPATFRVAVNRSYVGGEHELRPGDEVALIPPVSGG